MFRCFSSLLNNMMVTQLVENKLKYIPRTTKDNGNPGITVTANIWFELRRELTT